MVWQDRTTLFSNVAICGKKTPMWRKVIVLSGLIGLLGIGLTWAEKESTPPPKEKKIDPAEIEKEINSVKEELGKDYRVEYQEPFIIAGNTDESLFTRIKDGTIKRCSAALYQDFFKKKPDYLIKIYLFNDATCYQAYCKKTYGQKPSTPFGFYKHAEKKLIMDISTGTGTLVHEMVHALIAPDFPDVPPWLNEGLGSLYEQCQIEDNGSLKGLINWRYPRLKKAINADNIVKLKDLLEMNEEKFYDKDSDLHYAEARYFCMYLQKKKVLPVFYNQFRDIRLKPRSKEKDKEDELDLSGIKTLTKLLDKPIDEIEQDWKKWAVKLEKGKDD